MRPRDDRIIRRTSRTTTTYTVNGLQYHRLEDVPAEFRKLFEDKDGNGVPDIVDSMSRDLKADLVSNPNAKVTMVAFETTTSTSGSSLASWPPRLRQAVHRELTGNRSKSATIVCGQCGYDLTGTAVGGKCPECGTEVSATIAAMTESPSSTEMSLPTAFKVVAKFELKTLLIAICIAVFVALVVFVASKMQV